MAAEPVGDFEMEGLAVEREQATVMGVVVGIGQKVVFGEDIAGVEGAGHSELASGEDQVEVDSLASAVGQDQTDTHPEAGEFANTEVQSKKVQQSETWAAREQVVGYKVSVEALVLRVVPGLDAMGLDSDDVEREARTFDVMDHCH